MKKQYAAIGLLAALTASQAIAEEEKGWVFGPAFKDGWDPEFTVAIGANYIDPDIEGVDGDTGLGLQVSLNCPWFQPPKGLIRQQFNLNSFDSDGFEMTTFELNPTYYIQTAPSYRIGFGPGFGYMWADTSDGEEHNMWTWQLHGDVEYRQGALFLGAGARYQFTETETISPSDDSADNWLVQLKAGINF